MNNQRQTSNGVRIVYIANIRFPTERAHGAQIAKTCESFVNNGSEVSLWVPRRHTNISEDPVSFYGLSARFPVQRLFTIDSVAWGRWGFFLESILFALSVLLRARRTNADVFYCRDEIIVAILCLFGAPLVWESHTGAWGLFGSFAARRARRMVVISHGLKTFYVEKGIAASRILVAPDGVDLDAFKVRSSKESARTRLGLPHDAKIALYVGSIGSAKGTDVVFTAAELLPREVTMVIIGEGEERLETLRKHFPHILFVGARPYRELADNLAAADVLVLPSTAQNIVSARFTSPLKLFAYMASHVPIVASDVPSIREILDDETAFWFRADDPAQLASVIRRVFEEGERAAQKGLHASQKVHQYAWGLRAKKIIDFLSTDVS